MGGGGVPERVTGDMLRDAVTGWRPGRAGRSGCAGKKIWISMGVKPSPNPLAVWGSNRRVPWGDPPEVNAKFGKNQGPARPDMGGGSGGRYSLPEEWIRCGQAYM